MSMADQNSYMNATDISDELEEMDDADASPSLGGQVEAFIARNPVVAVASAFLAGVFIGGLVFAAANEATHKSFRRWG